MANNNKINTNSQRPTNLPFITKLKLFLLDLLIPLYTRKDGSINRFLFSLIDSKASAPSTKLVNQTYVSTSDVQIEPSRDLWFRLFVPSTTTTTNTNTDDKRSLPLIIYFHGGGFQTYGANSKTFDDLCTTLAAKTPAIVASINYRLSPEHKYPSQYDDGFDALKFIDSQNYAVLPSAADMSKCFIMGDSAGGNLAHHMTVRALSNRLERLKIVGLIAVQPFFGGVERTESELRLPRAACIDVKQTDVMWRNFFPEGADRNHPAAHVVNGPGSDIEFPRTLVFMGGYDPLQDWQRKYVEGLKGSGAHVEIIEYPNAFHSFYAFQELPEFKRLFDDVAGFVRKNIAQIE